jgi:sugar (pentulose or hexulose) kinase
VVGYDFSTGGAKALAFDTSGKVVAAVKLTTDLWTDYLPTDDPKLFRDTGSRELNLMLLEGQTHASTRALVAELGEHAKHWLVAGISATHHSAGRVDSHHNQVRRAICWNDQTLALYHAEGLARLGPETPKKLTGGPWAVRYSLSHLVKDAHIPAGKTDSLLSHADWQRTKWILPHGPLAAGYLTDRWGVTSVSSAASTGIMDLRTNAWCKEMLDAIAQPPYRELAWNTLPRIIDMNEPVGRLAEHITLDARLPPCVSPVIYPTLDDQAAGLIGGGAVDAGQVAVILGNSAVVNSSSAELPRSGNLDAMKLNWGPYLWMRCYSNGAQFLDRVVGPNRTKEEWQALTASAEKVPALCNGTAVMPFVNAEPSIGVKEPWVQWFPREPEDTGLRLRASFEAIAYLIARGIQEHEAAGQRITRISVSGGIAKNDLMVKILASVLNKPLERLVSDEGSALGAAVTALAGAEANARKAHRIAEPFTAADAVAAMVKFRDRIEPVNDWVKTYQEGFAQFETRLTR